MFFFVIRLLGVFAALLATSQAEEVIEQVQRELRARKYYFGAVDGRLSKETASAVKTFQRDKGLDAKGPIDEETLQALGLRPSGKFETPGAEERRACADWLVQYWRACEESDWEREFQFYAPEVDYYEDGLVDPGFIRRAHLERYAKWPTREHTILNRYVSLVPGSEAKEALATVWLRTDATARDGERRRLTEELRFRLRKIDGEWRMVELKLRESWPEAAHPPEP